MKLCPTCDLPTHRCDCPQAELKTTPIQNLKALAAMADGRGIAVSSTTILALIAELEAKEVKISEWERVGTVSGSSPATYVQAASVEINRLESALQSSRQKCEQMEKIVRRYAKHSNECLLTGFSVYVISGVDPDACTCGATKELAALEGNQPEVGK